MARQQQSELSRLETTGRTILFATSTIIKLSFYLVKFIFPSQRPKPSWPYKAAVGSTLTRWIFTYWTSIRLTTPRPLEGGKEASLFALATPGPSSLYAGPLSSSHTIRPGPLGNIWLPSRPSSSVPSTSTVFLHFHGGAYVVYSPRYRLASSPGDTFPAQLQDAVTAYSFLVQAQRVPPPRIVVSGDSAGGHLALSLLRYLQLHPESGLPLPRALLLHSPWLDLTPEGVITERKRNAGVDSLPTALLKWAAESFTPEGMDRRSEWISPLLHPFGTSVPIWVQVGTAEVLHGETLR